MNKEELIEFLVSHLQIDALTTFYDSNKMKVEVQLRLGGNLIDSDSFTVYNQE